jgi:GNAT superfamily N-acetyltransferase
VARSSIEVARSAWSELALTADAFQDERCQVIVQPGSRLAPSAWVGMVALGRAAVVTVPDRRTEAVIRKVAAGVAPNVLVDLDWSAAGAIDVLGPAALFFGEPNDVSISETMGQLTSSDEAIADLVRRASPEDAAEASLEDVGSPVFVLREGGRVVAASGYGRWLDSLAHLSVLVDPLRRRHGFGRAVAQAALAHALSEGLLPQWRARPVASQRLAESLGLVRLGSQVSARFDRP